MIDWYLKPAIGNSLVLEISKLPWRGCYTNLDATNFSTVNCHVFYMHGPIPQNGYFGGFKDLKQAMLKLAVDNKKYSLILFPFPSKDKPIYYVLVMTS